MKTGASLVVPLDSPDATLGACGGKGVNLVRLTRAGFPVPPGFVLVTDAYRAFVATHRLDPVIGDAVAGLDPSDAGALEAASARIRDAFAAGGVPASIADAVRAAWQQTFAPDAAVAVRSSATAEDLPDLSFAGQQDTFLNVVGPDAALAAVVRCWSSLWTARAIGYRARNGLPHAEVALAVVLQQLVPAEASGVLFTANPLTGARDQVVIDATWGLGEALVSGQVEPDHFVVDTASGRITRTPGAKTVVTSPRAGGGVTTSSRDADDRPALTDAQVRELASLGRSVAAGYGTPQDLEWAIADGTIHLVQARPITSLYPVPDGDADAVYFSFGAIQGMLQPMTPLGRDAIGLLLSGVTELVGPRIDLGAAGYLHAAGERLWVRVDRVLLHPVGARILPRVLPLLEPSAAAIVAGLAREQGWSSQPGAPSAASVRGVVRFAAHVLPHVPSTLIDPARRRRSFEARVAGLVEDAARAQAGASALGDPHRRLTARVRVMRATLSAAFPVLLRSFAPVIGPGMAMLVRLHGAASQAGDRARVLAMEILRGLPGNVTTEMDLALWRAASAIRADGAALRAVADGDAAVLAERFHAGGLPDAAQRAVTAFLDGYGMRGVGEIDLGQPRWRENPVDVFRTLQSYLRITDPEQAPDVVFARGREAAERATDELVTLLTQAGGARTPGGGARLRFMIDRLRTLLGARETPKFTMIRLLGLIREGLLASGHELVEAGVLERADDVFFLHLDELERLPQEPAEPWRAVVDARRQAADRERRRRQVPRMLAGDGRAFYEGLASTDAAISGSPVSPGVVEGLVRVVFDPQTTHLLPGEILVCPGTDPAWTPLFLSAGGLVTEVGGMMTHGSVVAREYGIPAVVGVHQATSRLRTGQRVRLDGMSGAIEILDDVG